MKRPEREPGREQIAKLALVILRIILAIIKWLDGL